MSSTDTSGVNNIGGVMIKKIFVDLYLVNHSRIVSGRVQPIPVETKTRYFVPFKAISRPRFRALSGNPLPSPRLVSIVIHADVSHLHGRYTLMLMQYGQFLDHDLTLTPINKVIIFSKPCARQSNQVLGVVKTAQGTVGFM